MSESGMKMNFCRVMAGMALRYRDNLAVVNVERGRRYTFPDYHRLTNRIANMARDTLGLRKGDVALLILDNDNFSLVHFPAIFKQEATFAFSNLRDSREEHARQIAYIKPKVVFIETRLIGAYRELLEREGCTIVAMDRERELPADALCFWDLIEAASEADNDVELNPREHISIIRFTGGTTGVGKCAMYTADHFFACRDSFYIHADFDCDESARYLALTPLSHASLMLFTAVFFTGGTTFSLNIADLPAWCETVQREGITHGLLVPTLLYRLLDMRGAELYRLSTLRTLVYGAAPIARPAVERLIRDFGQIFIQIYGSSEAATCVSVLNKRDHNVDSGLALERLGSAGRISPGVELIVTDADGVPLPTGTTGEIWIRSRATIGGYYQNPEGTAAEFANGFWKSGDLGYVDEGGYLFIVDRKKDMIISGGFNIYAVEVEAALSAHPAVLMSAVVGVPHPDWGEAVHAEIILREGAAVEKSELIDFVKAKIGYKAPKTVRFVDELPLSPVGKILRRHVKEQYWARQDRRV